LRLLSAEFVTSVAPGGEGIPRDGVSQVAFVGRSNVGKSSLINALGRAKIARTSAAPGKTRLANLYRLVAEGGAGGPGSWPVYFVDLPGYGYARGGADAAQELRAVSENYFGSTDLSVRRAVLLLVDSRHPNLESDRSAAQWIHRLNVVGHVVATKIDKLSRAERVRNLKTVENVFGTAAVPVSATSGEGLDVLWTLIARIARDVAPRG
jgi:GTP-binding protein